MDAIRVVRSLGPIDALSVRRDALLRWILALPLLVAIAARTVLPGFLQQAGVTFNTDLLPYFNPLLGVELALFAPALAGMIVGFLLLDQRDDYTLLALRVTPIPLAWYMGYRLAAPMVLSILLTIVTFPLAGITALGPLEVVLVALVAAPLAPMMTLVLGVFAENKVQGFALVKGLGVVLPAPLIAFFVDAPWTLLLGLVPTYWPCRVYWEFLAGSPNAWLFAIVGLAYQGFLVAVLLRRFEVHEARGSG